jgi:hypothetical protein
MHAQGYLLVMIEPIIIDRMDMNGQLYLVDRNPFFIIRIYHRRNSQAPCHPLRM